MRLAGKDNVLAAYWADLSEFSDYRVLIDSTKGTPLVFTRTGEKWVGARYRFKNMTGALYLLPYIDFYQEHFQTKTTTGLKKRSNMANALSLRSLELIRRPEN